MRTLWMLANLYWAAHLGILVHAYYRRLPYIPAESHGLFMLRKSVALRLAGLLSAGLCVGYLVSWAIQAARPASFKGRAIPEKGLLQFPQSVNSGDPENAVQDFREIYRALIKYRQKFHRLPTVKDLQDTTKDLVPGTRLAKDVFENPDSKYREIVLPSGSSPPPPYSFTYLQTPRSALERYGNVLTEADLDRPVFPSSGKKYVWADTNIYTRSNSRVFRDGRVDIHYAGCHVVLWSDGTIEKVPQSKLLFVQIGKKAWRFFYPGAANTPKEALPITLMWEEQRSKAKKGKITWE